MLAALMKDVYKVFHPFAYNPSTLRVFSNYTNRFNRHSNIPNNETVMAVGMQYVMSYFLVTKWDQFFAMPKDKAVDEYKRVTTGILGKAIGVEHIAALHDLQYLPVEVRALEEGTLVPYGVPSLTIETTVDGFGWVTNMLETQVSAMLWPIQTSATTAYAYRKRFEAEPSLDKEMIKYMGHDFSYRGDMGHVAAAMVGFGHLCSFKGSDSIVAGYFAEKFYGADMGKGDVLNSVDATEHSVMCSYGTEGELDSLKHLINNVSPCGILSIVSDTWDFWKLVTEYLPELKQDIMKREGKVVIRPDSGDPVDILCGKGVYFTDKIDTVTIKFMLAGGYSYVTSGDGDYYTYKYGAFGRYTWEKVTLPAANKGLIECLWDLFGGTTCDKTGLKKLDEHIGAIYGDSITLERQDVIIKRLKQKGFTPDVVLGIGSFTYQFVTRDTHGSAMKATAIKDKRGWHPIMKDPKTDSSKKSAKGFIKVISQRDGTLIAIDDVSPVMFDLPDNLLKPIFKNGKVLKTTSLTAIREKVDSYFK